MRSKASPSAFSMHRRIGVREEAAAQRERVVAEPQVDRGRAAPSAPESATRPASSQPPSIACRRPAPAVRRSAQFDHRRLRVRHRLGSLGDTAATDDPPNGSLGSDGCRCVLAEVRDWFERSFAEPTEAQRIAWPAIARGEHVLLSAPTGSGKTLAAFLWALDRLVAEPRADAGTRVLYISPLKALAYDIERNLRAPLRGIGAAEVSVGFALATLPSASGPRWPAGRRKS